MQVLHRLVGGKGGKLHRLGRLRVDGGQLCAHALDIALGLRRGVVAVIERVIGIIGVAAVAQPPGKLAARLDELDVDFARLRAVGVVIRTEDLVIEVGRHGVFQQLRDGAFMPAGVFTKRTTTIYICYIRNRQRERRDFVLKTLRNSISNEREARKVPRSVQASIPIEKIYDDGIWKVNNNFSRTWKMTDINFAVASDEDKRAMLNQFCSFLNSLPVDASIKITINNRKLNPKEFRRTLMLQAKKDGIDEYRAEYNKMLERKAAATQNMVQEKYITISVSKKTVEEARAAFTRIGTDMATNLARLSFAVTELGNKERLRILKDFFRPDEEWEDEIDLGNFIRHGHNFKDAICSDSIQFQSDYFEMDDKVGRVLFIKDYASFLEEDMIASMADVSKNIMLSIDILPIPTDEAVKEVQNKLLSVETDVTRWQRKQNDNYNFSANIPYDLRQMREEIEDFLDDITMRDERMMFALLTVVHTADDMEQLNADTESLVSTVKSKFSTLSVLRWQQEDGLKTVLPYGMRKIHALRTMTSRSITALHPFSVQEIRDKGGIFYGVNGISRNLIMCNRKNLQNGNAFILGVSGSGKSFIAKEELAFVALSTDDDILVVDPEREYEPLIRSLNGEVIRFDPDSKNHINALDMSREYGEGDNPITLKSSFVMSLYESVNNGRVEGAANSIVDRCVKNVYQEYIKSYTGEPPTLKELRRELLRQEEPLAKEIALALELFTEGSLNVFSYQTNVDMKNRIVCFDILDLGKQLKSVGMLIMLDSIMNRVMENRKKGKRTWVYIDEVYLFFANEYSANFLSESWKRFRKYGALATGITQNVSDCLHSVTARNMFSNSEFLILLNQAPADRIDLAELFHISVNQMKHIENTPVGQGLLKVGEAMVPFVNQFPKDTKLYELMTTKPEDK